MLKSIGSCSPVVLSAPQSRSAKAIDTLAQRITGPHATPVDEGAAEMFAGIEKEGG